MEIILSEYISYCSGVALAIQKMEKAINWAKVNNIKVYSLGNLIHNERVISKFEKEGVVVLEQKDIANVEPGIIVLRAHGVKEEVIRELLKKGFIIVDATCPIVLREHDLIKKADEKYHIVVIGKEKHPEAIFLFNVETSHKKTMVSKEEDISKLPSDVPLFVVIQSTFNQGQAKMITEKLKQLEEEDREVFIANRLCSSTKRRRDSLKDLADKCDCIIVIGGKHSSNTKGLARYAQNLGAKVFLVNSADQLPKEIFSYGKVGITTGTSTPKFIIDEIQAKLKGEKSET